MPFLQCHAVPVPCIASALQCQCLAVPCDAFLTKKHCLSLHQVIQNCIDEGRECRWVIGYVLVMGYANDMLEDLASVLQSDMYVS